MNRKQQLLKKHRQKKRLILIGFLVVTLVWLGLSIAFTKLVWWLPALLLGFWVYHETLLADHLFYSPEEDYQYQFPENTLCLSAKLDNHQLIIDQQALADTMDTIILAVTLKSNCLGNVFDPYLLIQTAQLTDRQDFEKSAQGIRYINLSGLVKDIQQGNLSITSHHCSLALECTLYAFSNPDYAQQSIMIIAPHADDAELAAFGIYANNPNASIVTLTQGEIEATHYQQQLSLDKANAAQLKGRLRSWDSIAIPLWAGIPTTRTVQLGYYCMQLKSMHESPDQLFPSKESNESDVRLARVFNTLTLPTDNDGKPTWYNLKQDLIYLIDHFKPEVIVTPHPELDPHEDHVQAALLVSEALEQTQCQPSIQLLYANHLHDNDRWPMGPANQGIALPPALKALPPYAIWSPVLSSACQLNKAMALAMQHDLQPPLPIKKRLRRMIQGMVTQRKHPKTGDNEFFRKAIRRHELFWVKPLQNSKQ